jgi:hypothetical protein
MGGREHSTQKTTAPDLADLQTRSQHPLSNSAVQYVLFIKVSSQNMSQIQMNSELDHIKPEDILAEFPFRNYNDQAKRIGAILWNWPYNVSETADQADISKKTHRDVRKAWDQLPLEEQIVLFRYLFEVVKHAKMRELRAQQAADR